MAPILAILWDQSMREMVTEVLALEGYSDVVTATNGNDGLRLIHEASRPAVILMDLIMPDGFGGRGVMQALNADPKLRVKHAVILLSPLVNLERFGHDLGPDRGLSQPFTVDQLIDAIQHCERILASRQGKET
jgi:CheY-like chemotaxis protein